MIFAVAATEPSSGDGAKRNLMNPVAATPSAFVARLVQSFLLRQKNDIVSWLRRGGHGSPPSYDRWLMPMVSSLRPAFQNLYQTGAAQAARRIASVSRIPLRGKAYRWYRRKAMYIDLFLDLFNPRIKDAIDSAVFAFAQSTLDTAVSDVLTAMANVRQQLTEGLEQGEAVDRFNRRIGQIFDDPFRASRVAQTEVSRAVNGGEYLLAKETGIVGAKEWIISGDACDLCKTIHRLRRKVPLDEPFAVLGAGDFARWPSKAPYNIVMYPPAHPFCMCAWAPVVGQGVSPLPKPHNPLYDLQHNPLHKPAWENPLGIFGVARQ